MLISLLTRVWGKRPPSPPHTCKLLLSFISSLFFSPKIMQKQWKASLRLFALLYPKTLIQWKKSNLVTPFVMLLTIKIQHCSKPADSSGNSYRLGFAFRKKKRQRETYLNGFSTIMWTLKWRLAGKNNRRSWRTREMHQTSKQPKWLYYVEKVAMKSHMTRVKVRRDQKRE